MYIPAVFKIKPVFLCMKPFCMVQYGIPRSGSTLIYNLMMEIFPKKKIFKVHRNRKMCSILTTVGTYRNPMDAIASLLLIQKIEKPSDSDIQKEIDVYIDADFNEIPEMMNMPNILMVKYENFVKNHAYIYDKFESFFDIKIPPAERQKLQEKYSISNVREKTDKLKNFSNIDRKSQLHGGHISKFSGSSGYFKDLFSETQIDMIKDVFGETMQILGNQYD